MDPFSFDTFDPRAPQQPAKGLGFATPGVEMAKSNFIDDLRAYGNSGSRHDNILSQIEVSATKPDQVSKTVANTQVETKPFSLDGNYGVHSKRIV